MSNETMKKDVERDKVGDKTPEAVVLKCSGVVIFRNWIHRKGAFETHEKFSAFKNPHAYFRSVLWKLSRQISQCGQLFDPWLCRTKPYFQQAIVWTSITKLQFQTLTHRWIVEVSYRQWNTVVCRNTYLNTAFTICLRII